MSTSGDSVRLKPKQIKALAALASGLSDAKVCEIAHTTPRTLAGWRKDAGFAAELDNLLRYQRDRVQGLLGVLAQESEQTIRDALGAATDDGQPAHGVRLRAAEAALSTYVRISQRATELQAPQLGPLIVLPTGTQRMALAVEVAPGAPGAPGDRPALTVDVTPPALPAAAPPDVTPRAPDGLPQWWKPLRRPIR